MVHVAGDKHSSVFALCYFLFPSVFISVLALVFGRFFWCVCTDDKYRKPQHQREKERITAQVHRLIWWNNEYTCK